MSSPEDAITAGVARIRDELQRRLEFTLSEKDEIALATAITKAARMAFLEGVKAVEQTKAVYGALGKTSEVTAHFPDRDFWQEIYGDGNEEG